MVCRVCMLAAMLLLAYPASAAEPSNPASAVSSTGGSEYITKASEVGAPHSDTKEALERDRGWLAGTMQQQLDRDRTRVPFGKGAIFVPAMTNGLDEPIVSVWSDITKVAEGITGARIVVRPGKYSLSFGSGRAMQALAAEVEVVELHTSVVPVTWSGLSVHVVNERLTSLRGSYELIHLESRDFVGVGFGADEQAGEAVSTWILPPGLYKIVRVGESYRARQDFATVLLTADTLTHFLLVVNEDDGSFAGAGVIPQDELFVAQQERWVSLVLGGDLSLNTAHNVLGREDGATYSLRGFLDTKLNWTIAHSPLILQLQVEEGETKAPNSQWQKTQDLLDVAVLYVYRIQPWLGPYVRMVAQTNLFEGRKHFDSSRDLVIYDDRGQVIGNQSGVDEVLLSPSFGRIEIREGIGVNTRVVKTSPFELTLRTGLGARHRIARDLLQQLDDAASGAAQFSRVASVDQVGIEAIGVATVRASRFLVASGEVEALVPFDDPEAVLFDAEATVSAKITNYLSVNYIMRYQRDPTLEKPRLWEHNVLLRFSVAVD